MAELGSTNYAGVRESLISSASHTGPQSSAQGEYAYTAETWDDSDLGSSAYNLLETIPLPVVPSPQRVVYRMRGRDVDCPTLTYRYWYSPGTPDLSAALYTGPKCGVSPLAEVKVVDNQSA